MKILLFLISLPLFASEYQCSNPRFLVEEVELLYKEGTWLMNSCELEEKQGALVPLAPEYEECRLKNLSRPDRKREVLGIKLGENVVSSGEGYIQLSLDNSFADYGPQKLTSFLYCRKPLL